MNMAHLHTITKAIDTLYLNSVECKCCKVEICIRLGSSTNVVALHDLQDEIVFFI
jgi:hypothetical protein